MGRNDLFMLLTVNHLNISYAGIPAVRDVGFTVAENEVIGIAGESGCGKSTLLRSIMVLLKRDARIDSGAIRFKGKELTRASRSSLQKIRGRQISMIFQNAGLAMDPIKTIQRHFFDIASAGRGGISKDQARQRAIGLMENLRLRNPEGFMSCYPFEVSGGMQQRIAVAMAMFHSPDLILADEPTSDLDVTAQARVVKMLGRLKQEARTAMVIVSHNIGVIAQLADKVGIMYGGRIVEWGTTRDVLDTPSHPYTQALINAIPKMNGALPGVIPWDLSDRVVQRAGCGFAHRCSFSTGACHETPPKRQALSSSHWIRCKRRAKPGEAANVPV